MDWYWRAVAAYLSASEICMHLQFRAGLMAMRGMRMLVTAACVARQSEQPQPGHATPLRVRLATVLVAWSWLVA